MSIDSISGPKGPKEPKGPTQKAVGDTSVQGVQPTQTQSASQTSVQTLAQEVRQGNLSYDDAITRFAADVVSRRYPDISGSLREKAIIEVGRALSQDPSFKGRFSRLMSEAS
jgi:hypothetical protein